MWIARNKDGTLTLFEGRPTRNSKDGIWEYYTIFSVYRLELKHWFSSKIININLFPDLKWEDEPIEVELIQKDIRKN